MKKSYLNPSSHDDTGHVTALNEALHWIRVSKLQIERYVENLSLAAESAGKNTTDAVADGHFLLNSLAQSKKALERANLGLPKERALQLKCLRDIHEHWEQHKESFASPNRPKNKSGKDFTDAYPNAIPWVFKIDSTGVWISNLCLDEVWQELLDKEAEISQMLVKLVDPANIQRNSIIGKQAKFPRRESKVLGFSMITQNIVLDFK